MNQYYSYEYDRPHSKQQKHKKCGRSRKRRHPSRKILTFLILTAFILTGYARFIEPYILTADYMNYSEPLLTTTSAATPDAGSLKIALFADTHFSEYYTPENFQKVITRINNESPDIVFFLGDLVDEYDTYEGDIKEIERCLADINANIGKYAVYGNHDYGGGMQFKYPDIMEAGGFKLLINESEMLEQYNLCILGIDDMLIGYGDPSAAWSLDSDCCNIVVCHEPDVFDMISDCSIDLMFAGHTHGRQINIKPLQNIISPKLGSKYVKGSFDFSNARQSSLYVTSGIGTTKLPLRFGMVPEVNIITVE